MIKPQFELTPKEVPHGIVKTEENRQKAIASLKEFFNENIKEKFCAKEAGLCLSPITGVHGNTEYLWHILIGK